MRFLKGQIELKSMQWYFQLFSYQLLSLKSTISKYTQKVQAFSLSVNIDSLPRSIQVKYGKKNDSFPPIALYTQTTRTKK